MTKSPCAGLLPITRGALSLSEEDAGTVTSLASYDGQAGALSEALQAAHGVSFPAPGRVRGQGGTLCSWSGLDQAFLIGPEPDPDLSRYAAVTDQSDAWAVVRLTGAGCEDVLARLVPVDLRLRVFSPGQSARSLLGHLPVLLLRQEVESFLILAFRSMAGTLVEDLDTAMSSVTARSGG
ncbi:sarcosine oxidase subunit gamma [Puniceibacterium sediminis]|nr:sarcosine oxidase subunit gamma [Puniceibacterium sediminis]